MKIYFPEGCKSEQTVNLKPNTSGLLIPINSNHFIAINKCFIIRNIMQTPKGYAV